MEIYDALEAVGWASRGSKLKYFERNSATGILSHKT